MGLLNVGASALMANQVALQTAGNNIANVNTAGYSRQTVVLQTVQGQFTGGGYIGQGVDVATILRNQDNVGFLLAATQGAMAATAQARKPVARSTGRSLIPPPPPDSRLPRRPRTCRAGTPPLTAGRWVLTVSCARPFHSFSRSTGIKSFLCTGT